MGRVDCPLIDKAFAAVKGFFYHPPNLAIFVSFNSTLEETKASCFLFDITDLMKDSGKYFASHAHKGLGKDELEN